MRLWVACAHRRGIAEELAEESSYQGAHSTSDDMGHLELDGLDWLVRGRTRDQEDEGSA